MMHKFRIVRPETKKQVRLSTQHIPQYVEVPPNLEAKRIVSYFSAVLSCLSNPTLLKDESQILIFPVLGKPFAITFCDHDHLNRKRVLIINDCIITSGGNGAATAGSGNDQAGKKDQMLFTIAVVLIILWLLGLVSGYTMGSFIHILFVAALSLLVVSLSQEVMNNQKLRIILRSRYPKQDRRKKGLQPIFLPPTYKKE